MLPLHVSYWLIFHCVQCCNIILISFLLISNWIQIKIQYHSEVYALFRGRPIQKDRLTYHKDVVKYFDEWFTSHNILVWHLRKNRCLYLYINYPCFMCWGRTIKYLTRLHKALALLFPNNHARENTGIARILLTKSLQETTS